MLVNDGVTASLEQLLAESVGDATARERSAFDAAAAGRDGIVLVGIGGLGQRVLRALRTEGITPCGLADNAVTRQGTVVGGQEVLSVAEAAARFGERATFVVTIWGAGSTHRYAHTRDQLSALGVRSITPFPLLLWKYPAGTLPHYCQDLPHRVLEQAAGVRSALTLWDDERSRREYLSQVRFRLLADFDGLSHPIDGPQYFPEKIFDDRTAECFVDCGAYDGDTIRVLVARYGDMVRRVIALEPDPVNHDVLIRYAATVGCPGGVEVLPFAAAASRGHAYIQTTGTASSALTESDAAGATEIECAPLDELLQDEKPTFIKMDIEGAEPQALLGARQTIRRDRPVLAVCVYHEQDHLWRIPLSLREVCDDYRFYLRPHNEEGWDLVCYAVPEERLSRDARATHG